jgi:hypothetical protein
MYTVIAATSATIRQMLLDAMLSDVGPSGLAAFFTGSTTVSLETPQEMTAAGRQGLSVWLYRVERDEDRLNDPPQIRTLPTGEVEVLPPPLPLRLHYLLTPLGRSSTDTEQRVLGRAMQLFHSIPIIAGGLLRAELAGTAAELHVHLEALGLDEITRVWDALEGSYQLCVSYEVTLARINASTDPVVMHLVESVVAGSSVIVDQVPA